MKFGSPAEIHLEDFPLEKIVVFLDNDFRRMLVDESVRVVGSRKKFGEYLGIKKLDTISRWKDGKINRGAGWVTPQGIPLVVLNNISCLLTSSGINEFSMREIEKHVTAYKSKGKSLWIINPKLPVKETPELFRLIAHMIGDGSAEENSVNYFKNTNPDVLSEFLCDIRSVFGEVEFTVIDDVVVFPITIRHILSKMYNIEFGTFTAEIPRELFNLNKNFAAGFIRGFMDDEGNVDTSQIRMYSFNKKVIYSLRELIQNKFPEFGPVFVREREKVSVGGKHGTEYTLEIKSQGICEFYRQISCSHSDKMRKLQAYVSRKGNSWNHRGNGYTKLLILRKLLDSPKTINELSENLSVSSTSVLIHLKGYYQDRKMSARGLLEDGLVASIGYGKYGAALWDITEQGKTLLNGHANNLTKRCS